MPSGVAGGIYEANLVGFEPADLSGYTPAPGVPFPKIYVEVPRLMPGRRYGPLVPPFEFFLVASLFGEAIGGGEGVTPAQMLEVFRQFIVVYVGLREGRADDVVAIGMGMLSLPIGEEPPPEEPPPEDPPPDP